MKIELKKDDYGDFLLCVDSEKISCKIDVLADYRGELSTKFIGEVEELLSDCLLYKSAYDAENLILKLFKKCSKETKKEILEELTEQMN